MAESLCQKRALEAFQLDPAKWGGNKQCLTARSPVVLSSVFYTLEFMKRDLQ